jgi:hypothetical protein
LEDPRGQRCVHTSCTTPAENLPNVRSRLFRRKPPAMKRISAGRVAQIGIGVQFLALIRTLSEYFRLKHFGAQPITVAAAEPYITGALMAAVGAAISVGFYFFRKYKVAVLVAAATVLLLLLYKVAALPRIT